MNQVNSLRFSRANLKEFYPELKRRVDEYFTQNNLSKNANGAMIRKTVFILVMYLTSYGLLLSNMFSPGVLLIIALVNGFFTALIGLNIAHDAIHGSYSSKGWVNKLLGTTFNIIGANDYMWKVKHNMIHHTWTNVPGHDDDIDQDPVFRMNPNQKLKWFHKFQHIYCFFVYPLASLMWVFIKDFTTFYAPKFARYHKKDEKHQQFARMITFKIIYYILFIAVPFLVIDLPWYYILIGFIAMHLVEGMTIAFIFQLAHVVEGADFPEPDEKGNLENNWAVHQLYTTADFARENPLVCFLFGGLNFQVEHHLFPQVCHIHYPKIAPIVEQTAKEYGLPYLENKTLTGAMASHTRLMWQFGHEQRPAFLDEIHKPKAA